MIFREENGGKSHILNSVNGNFVKGWPIDGRNCCCYCLFLAAFLLGTAFLLNESESLFLICLASGVQEDLSNL